MATGLGQSLVVRTLSAEEAEVCSGSTRQPQRGLHSSTQRTMALRLRRHVLSMAGQLLCFSKKERKKVKSLSRVGLFATPWTVAHQAPLSMGFLRQEY